VDAARALALQLPRLSQDAAVVAPALLLVPVLALAQVLAQVLVLVAAAEAPPLRCRQRCRCPPS
jgi:hypothetical protein